MFCSQGIRVSVFNVCHWRQINIKNNANENTYTLHHEMPKHKYEMFSISLKAPTKTERILSICIYRYIFVVL